MSKKDKKLKEQQLMAFQEKEAIISHVLRFSKIRFKKFDEIILRLYRSEDLSSFFTDRRIAKVYECFSNTSVDTSEKAILKNVLVRLEKHSMLVSTEDLIQAVFNIVKFRSYWRRNIFEWLPSSGRGEVQVNELASFLFCQYKVPAFLYKAFYEKTNLVFINWLIHLGTGKKVKELINMPIPFTQKMGHYFLQAPDEFTIAEALRWAQVKGLNGDDKLAERMAYSWMGTKTYGDEIFWEAFIRIITNGGMFNHDRLTELIDYVREVKRENPGYSLKGRTLQSLMRQNDEWHKSAMLTKGNKYWSSCGFYGYKNERKEQMIKMEELTGSKLLSEEGKAMRHCVGSYALYCETGKTAIFSLRKYTMGLLTERLATIEVNMPLRKIVQAKAKMNKRISEEARKHLDAWAIKNELAISAYL